MPRQYRLPLLIFLLTIFTAGTVFAWPPMPHKLRHKEKLDYPVAHRSAQIDVSDERELEDDMPPERLGTWRGGYGNPYELTNKGDPPASASDPGHRLRRVRRDAQILMDLPDLLGREDRHGDDARLAVHLLRDLPEPLR